VRVTLNEATSARNKRQKRTLNIYILGWVYIYIYILIYIIYNYTVIYNVYNCIYIYILCTVYTIWIHMGLHSTQIPWQLGVSLTLQCLSSQSSASTRVSLEISFCPMATYLEGSGSGPAVNVAWDTRVTAKNHKGTWIYYIYIYIYELRTIFVT